MVRTERLSWINAKLWVGEEVEDGSKEKRLFVDGASYEEIVEVLEKNPDIKGVYFAHQKNWDVIRKLVNKVRIIVEVGIEELRKIPIDVLGEVEVVLRVPNFVRFVKSVRDFMIKVADFERGKFHYCVWEGKKVYSNDKIVRGD